MVQSTNTSEHQHNHETIRSSNGGDDTPESKDVTDRDIIESLLRNYRFPDPSAQIPVSVHVSIDRIVNDFEHECHFWITIRQKWIEKRLTFERQRPNSSQLRLRSGSYIWNPSIIVANALEVKPIGKEIVELSSNGIVEFIQRLSVKTNELHSLSDFPLDKRNCTVQLFSEDSRAQWTEVTSISGSMIGWGSWQLIDWDRYDRSIVLRLRRSIITWIWTLYAPTIALASFSWIFLWISDSRIHKFVVQIVIFITTLITVFANSWNVTRTGYLKALDIWNYQIVIFVFASMSYTAIAQPVSDDDKRRKCTKNINGFDDEKTQWLSSEAPYYAHLTERKTATTMSRLFSCILRLLLPLLLIASISLYSIRYVLPYIK